MKNKLNILASMVLFVTAYSCQDSGVSEDFIPSIEGHYIEISQNSLSFPSKGGELKAELTTNKSPWAFTESPDWMTISPKEGENSATVTFSAEENLSADITRTSVFYLMSTDENWKYRHFMSAQQTAAIPYLDLSSYSLQFKGGMSSERVLATTNTKFNAICSDSWVHAEVSESCNTVDISVDENLTGLSRTATVQLNGTINKAITITQQAADLTGESDELHFTCDEGSIQVKFESEASWTAMTSSQWIEVTPEEGKAGNNSIQISVTANTSQNERIDYVYLKIGETSKLQIPIRQDGVYINTDVKMVEFSASTSTQKIIVNSNIVWEIVSCPDWITPSVMSLKGDGEIVLTAEENPNTSNRDGVVKIGQPGFSYAIDVTVKQSGMSLSSNANIINFDDQAQSKTINLNTVGKWSAESNVDWITISPISGSGVSEITISVTENTLEQERAGQVSVKVGNLEETIKVIQTGKYFSYSANELSVGSTGGTIKLSLITNEKWSIEKPENTDWMQIKGLEGAGNTTVDIVLDDNPSIKARECTLRVIPENSPEVQIPISQSGRFLTIDHTALYFFAKGGTSEAIIIDTDGEISISCSLDWITINRPSDKIFTVTAERSMLLDPREGVIQISLTNLANDEKYSVELKVTQKAVSEVFECTDYDEDEDWN